MHPALHRVDEPAAAQLLPRARSGWAEGPLAVFEAVTDAVAGMPRAGGGVVLLFPDAALPADEVLAQAAAAAPGYRLAGMTSDGLITTARVRARGCSALALRAGVT